MDFGVLDCFLVYYYHPQKQYACVCTAFFYVYGWGGFACRMVYEVARTILKEKDASSEASIIYII